MILRKRYIQCFISLLTAFCFTNVSAQYTLRIQIEKPAFALSADSIFITGKVYAIDTFIINHTFPANSEDWFIDVPGIKGEDVSYTISTGWKKGKKSQDNLFSRNFNLLADTEIRLNIPPIERRNVHDVDTVFTVDESHQVNLRIYLPKGYAAPGKKFPVLYFIGSRQVFDIGRSGTEWMVDETLDSLEASKRLSAIVIEISFNAEVKDIDPFIDSVSLGAKLSELIAKQVKPYIDRNYKTLSMRNETFIAGSSFAANLAYYSILKYPEIYGRAGIFSPVFDEQSDALKSFTAKHSPRSSGMLFFYVGEHEDEKRINASYEIINSLGRSSKTLLYSVVDPDGSNDIISWQKWFPEFYQWVSSNGLDYIIR